MGRSIVDAFAVRPRFRAGAFCVPAPDEDAFTLAVAALEPLAEKAGVDRIELVGPFDAGAAWRIREALATPHASVRLHTGSAGALLGALAAAVHEGSGESSLVAAVELPAFDGEPRESTLVRGATAVGWRFAKASGVIPAPPEHHPKRPGGLEDLAGVRRSAARAAGSGPVVVLAERPEAVVRASPTEPGKWVVGDFAPEGIGRSPMMSVAWALRDHGSRSSPPAFAIWASDAEFVHLAGFRIEGPITAGGEFGPPTAGTRVPAESFLDPLEATDRRSEGAYVPHPRYVENLPSRWRFAADRCPTCSHVTFPVAGTCRGCGAVEGLVREELPRSGVKVEATTVVAPGAQPTEFDPMVAATGAYEVAIVRLSPEVRVTLPIADARPGELAIGDSVDTHLRRLFPLEGEWRYGRKAVRPTPA